MGFTTYIVVAVIVWATFAGITHTLSGISWIRNGPAYLRYFIPLVCLLLAWFEGVLLCVLLAELAGFSSIRDSIVIVASSPAFLNACILSWWMYDNLKSIQSAPARIKEPKDSTKKRMEIAEKKSGSDVIAIGLTRNELLVGGALVSVMLLVIVYKVNDPRSSVHNYESKDECVLENLSNAKIQYSVGLVNIYCGRLNFEPAISSCVLDNIASINNLNAGVAVIGICRRRHAEASTFMGMTFEEWNSLPARND